VSPDLPRLKAAFARLSGRPALFGVLAVVAILLVAGAIHLVGEMRARAAATALAKLEHDAQLVANEVTAQLQPQFKALNELAKDPRVIAALSSPFEEARRTLAADLQQSIPGALLLRLLPAGSLQTDPDSSPPLTYSSLDLVLKAEDSTLPPGAELHLAGTPNEHIAVVRRAPPEGQPVGYLHLSIAPAALRDSLSTLLATSKLGEAEIRQPISGAAPVVIAATGQSTGHAVEALTRAIAGTAWVLALRSPTRTADGVASFSPLWLLPVLVILGGLLVKKRLRPRMNTNGAGSTVYQGAIHTILSGQNPALAQLLPGAPLTAPTAPPRTARQPEVGPPAEETAPTATIIASTPPAPGAAPAGTFAPIPPSIFRSYDIRGIVGETLTVEGVYQIGRAFGAEAAARNQQTVIVARDGRTSSLALRGALVEGLRDAGRDVLDIGLTPTPVLYFATHYLDTRTGVMVTGSHNPGQYNGLKMVLDGETLSGAAIQAIRERIETQSFTSGTGSLQEIEIVPDYIRRISEDIPVSLGDALKVVVDCGNGVPGIVAPHILRAIGHDVIELYCEVDGDFPNHHPDPSQPENLEDLIAIVRHEQADLGLAFDGDGDRLGVVDREGNILWPDRQLMLFAEDVLSRNPGARIIYDVKCSPHLADVIRKAGGEPIMSKSGHSLIKQKMQETGALLGGEFSGHIFFKERWYGFDDALYSAARLLEILVNANQPAEQVFARLPQACSTPELRMDMPEERHAAFMTQVREALDFPDGEINELDGVRVDFKRSWGLIRPSNTTPCLVLRFEGDDEAALHEVQERFRTLLTTVDPTLTLPF